MYGFMPVPTPSGLSLGIHYMVAQSKKNQTKTKKKTKTLQDTQPPAVIRVRKMKFWKKTRPTNLDSSEATEGEESASVSVGEN